MFLRTCSKLPWGLSSLSFAVQKPDTFHTVMTQNVLAPNKVTVRKEEKRASEICCPTQRNAAFILVCTIFD